MTGKLQDRVAIVFGAGSVGEGWGNGKASAVAYARAGARVACVDMNETAARATADIIAGEGGKAIALRADVTRLDEVRAATEETVRALGRLDVLHNNVGITAAGGPVEASEESWDRVMSVNVKSMFFTCKCALPIMVEQGRGAIINISSLAGIRWTGYNYSSYYASKAAVINFTRGVAIEYAARGIRANSILPGLMDTPHIYQQITTFYASVEEMVQARHKLSPTGRMGTAWDVANAAVFLASDDAAYINGVELPVDGGLHAKAGV
ncbi:SDR family NAD(P)-dependent oxidoreductase [Microvirga massiliensis]|uniref:SDR family NAD(P)-dependent oxidoreductase n=1 Tax=Microvirga massiliensis TaxID=1033741 RepID=UPI00062BECF5|nr:SDR family oxidoreductase [Microvirga massiliensis]